MRRYNSIQNRKIFLRHHHIAAFKEQALQPPQIPTKNSLKVSPSPRVKSSADKSTKQKQKDPTGNKQNIPNMINVHISTPIQKNKTYESVAQKNRKKISSIDERKKVQIHSRQKNKSDDIFHISPYRRGLKYCQIHNQSPPPQAKYLIEIPSYEQDCLCCQQCLSNLDPSTKSIPISCFNLLQTQQQFFPNIVGKLNNLEKWQQNLLVYTDEIRKYNQQKLRAVKRYYQQLKKTIQKAQQYTTNLLNHSISQIEQNLKSMKVSLEADIENTRKAYNRIMNSCRNNQSSSYEQNFLLYQSLKKIMKDDQKYSFSLNLLNLDIDQKTITKFQQLFNKQFALKQRPAQNQKSQVLFDSFDSQKFRQTKQLPSQNAKTLQKIDLFCDEIMEENLELTKKNTLQAKPAYFSFEKTTQNLFPSCEDDDTVISPVFKGI